MVSPAPGGQRQEPRGQHAGCRVSIVSGRGEEAEGSGTRRGAEVSGAPCERQTRAGGTGGEGSGQHQVPSRSGGPGGGAGEEEEPRLAQPPKCSVPPPPPPPLHRGHSHTSVPTHVWASGGVEPLTKSRGEGVGPDSTLDLWPPRVPEAGVRRARSAGKRGPAFLPASSAGAAEAATV